MGSRIPPTWAEMVVSLAPSARGRPSLPGCQERVSVLTLECWAEQVPESCGLCDPGLWRWWEASGIAKPMLPPWDSHILVELIFLTSMPSSLSPRPQYPEFSQDREKITRARPGEGKSPTLGSLFV